MRTNLKIFRVKQRMTQGEISEKICCTRATYSAIESGKRSGRSFFWESLQTTFKIPDEEMWSLRKDE